MATINIMDNQEPKINFLNPEEKQVSYGAGREEEILEFWKKNKIFEKSVEQRKGKKKFVFYEGPPYANGRPGIHHVEARAFKDVILRYKTMRGFYAPRRAGWDTHGLPTEIEVEKKLGIKSKKEIEEKIGIEKFIEEARTNVFLYKEEWEKLTERMAYWLDMKNAYATMTNDYIETLWWIFKEIDKRKLLYEDYKIIPWCPRCGTALSSHELSLGYKKIKEDSIYIKFPVKDRPNTYFLVWTTTPWTLPSNVALAVNPKINYVIIGAGDEKFILAKSRLSIIEGEYKIGEEKSGADLVAREYEPLYPSTSLGTSPPAPYKIFAADFVSADDGTGIVHIAPAFGEDDMKLGKANNFPVLSLVSEEGKMLAPKYKWDKLFIKDADPLIVEDLKARNLLYKTESYEHDYPFCWRCESPLMYYAKNSWWLKTTAVKKRIISENKKINWHPEYLRAGRFGEWLNELRDWAISRERYWGTPLPIWRCLKCLASPDPAKRDKATHVVGSIAELKNSSVKSGNNYFLMRHGFAENNQKNIINSNIEINNYFLLPRGQKEVLKSAQKLKNKKIDLIFSSDFSRCKETAAIAARALGVAEEKIIFDEHLREINTGIFDAKPAEEYCAHFSSLLEKFSKTPPNGENLSQLKNRVAEFIYDLEKKYEGKNILIISHEHPIWLMFGAAEGLNNEEAARLRGERKDFIKTGEIKKLDFAILPHDKNFVLDLHRPYIDGILLKCEKCGAEMRRIKDVADVWFDSGAMPFAQAHFPFAFTQSQISNLKSQNLEKLFKKLEYPADYICEAIDQTRGWFFTLLAVSGLLGKKAPYKNVLSLGLVLDAKGQKMSKSKGNIVLPMELINKYGSDAVRWYFYTINQPWDEKLFREDDVASALRRFILIFWNCFSYWRTYGGKKPKLNPLAGGPKLAINKWIIAKFSAVAGETAGLMDNYDVVLAARALENFVINDVSHWYIRRVREIMKNPVSKGAKETSAVFGDVILNTAKLLAPFIPFAAEMICREIKGENKSVHLEDFPIGKTGSKEQKELLKNMEAARDIVSMVLEARAKAGIRVRQPLAALKISAKGGSASGGKNIKLNEELLDLIKGEVNIKNIFYDKNISGEMELDTILTDELKEEGLVRDLVRQMQDIRKKEGLKPPEIVVFGVAAAEKEKNFLIKCANDLKKSINAEAIIIRESIEGGYEAKVGDLNFKIKIEK